MQIVSKYNITTYIPFTIFTFVNILFCIRYIGRESIWFATLIGIVYLAISFVLYTKCSQIHFSAKTIGIMSILWCGICICLLYYAPIETIRVDRYEMIDLFWDAVKNGEYPYDTKGAVAGKGNAPGPMPFYYILLSPIYLIKNYAIIPIISILLLVFYLRSKTPSTAGIVTLFVFISPACYWEIVGRSTLLINSCLFLIWLNSLQNLNDKNNLNFYLSAIIGGLLLSTRFFVFIPLFFYVVYSLRNTIMPINRILKWCVCIALTFILTFIPLITTYGIDNFLKINPFIVQANHVIPFELSLLTILPSLLLVCFCTSFKNVMLYSGIAISVIISIYLIIHIYYYGFFHAILYSCDISYYIFAFPFLLYSFSQTSIQDAK